MDEDCENVFKGWENLDTDILVTIFQKYFSLQELISSRVAHVCSRWRVACCAPILWNTLDLSLKQFVNVPHCSNEEMTRLLKISMSLSKGNTKTLIFHSIPCLTADMITYTTRRCRNLRRLELPYWKGIDHVRSICNAISFCKKLESLTMFSMTNPHLVFESIRENCKKFRELNVTGLIELFFAQNLVTVLPKLKVLSLSCTAIHQDALIKILEKMKKLEIINISHSYIVTRDTEIAWSTVVEKVSMMKWFVTCSMDHEICVMCRRTKDEGILSWYPCKLQIRSCSTFELEERLWKKDELSSLHL